jgi:hypothetical protein
MQVPTLDKIEVWLNEFPDFAMRNVSMGDLSIIKEWEEAKKRTPRLRVFIWSLDQTLRAYDFSPR